MDFKELHYIIAIWKYGTISKAADSLGITQPSLSKYVQNLEEKNKVNLFKRNGKRLVLTYVGERYVKTAERILSLAESLEPGFFSDKKPKRERLRVFFPLEKGVYILPFIVHQFKRKYPDVNLILTEKNPGNAEQMLIAGETDIAFTNVQISNENIHQECLLIEEILLVTTANHPLAHEGVWRPGFSKPWIDIKRFKYDSFVLLAHKDPVRMKVDALLKKEDITPNILLETNYVATAIKVVATGDGVCLSPEISARSVFFREPLTHFSVGEPSLKMETYLTCRKGSQLSNEAMYFIKLVKDFIGNIEKSDDN